MINYSPPNGWPGPSKPPRPLPKVRNTEHVIGNDDAERAPPPPRKE